MSSLFHPVHAILDKLSKQDDPDVRFMCLRDLAAELNRMAAHVQQQAQAASAGAAAAGASGNASIAQQQAQSPPPPPLDGNAQAKLCRILQPQLMCTQGDVSEAAVRCLPGLLCAVGDSALLDLLDALLQFSFAPARALPPEHLQSEEVADEREKEARLESLRMKALLAMRTLWRELTQPEAQAKVARKIMPPVIKLIQQSTDKKGAGGSVGEAASSSSASASALTLTFPQLTLGQLVDFVSFLQSLLSAHPEALVPFHASLLSLFHSLLLFEGAGLLQLSMECVTAVAPHLAPASIDTFVQRLCAGWGEFQARRREAACMAALGALVRVSSNAFQPHLPAVLPLVQQLLDQPRYESAEEEREAALLCLESIIRCAAAAVLPFLLSLLPSIQRAASYDPNFVGDHTDPTSRTGASIAMADTADGGRDDDDDGDGDDYGLGGGDDDEEQDEVLNDYVDDGGDEGNVSDDEDSSWKVRRASARCIQALLGIIVVASGTTSGADAQQHSQAFASSLPPLYVSTHAALNRPLVERLAVSLASLLLPRLTERTDYIQVDLLAHYEQLLAWGARNAKQLDLSSGPAGANMSLQLQLCRLLETPLKAKQSAADVRTLEQIASLLSTAMRCVPAPLWLACPEHSSRLFALLTRRATESMALLPALPTLLSTNVHFITAISIAWQRIPASLWATEANAWSALPLRWLGGLKEGDRIAGAASLPLSMACVRTIATLVQVLLSTNDQLAHGSKLITIANALLPTTQMEITLDASWSTQSAAVTKSDEKAAVEPPPWALTVDQAVAIASQLHAGLVALLADARADRSLQSSVLHSLGRLYATFAPASSAIQLLLIQNEATVWGALVRLVEFPHSRAATFEMCFQLLRVSPVPSTQIAAVRSMLVHLASTLKQRERSLLRAAILALNTFAQRAILQDAPAAAVEVLQQAVQPILAFSTESGELVAEQSCALVLLANILRLLSTAAPLRASILALLSSAVLPTLTEWVHSNALTAHPLTLGSIRQVFESCCLFAEPAQREEWVSNLRGHAVRAKDETLCTVFSSLLCAVRWAEWLYREIPVFDLGAHVAAYKAHSAEALQALVDSVKADLALAQQTDAAMPNRIVALHQVGTALFALGAVLPTDTLSPLLNAAAQSLPPAELDSPLGRAFARAQGLAVGGGGDSQTLIGSFVQTPSTHSALALRCWSGEITGLGIANLDAQPEETRSLLSIHSLRLADRLTPVRSHILDALLPSLPQLSVPVAAELLADLCILVPVQVLGIVTNALAQSSLDARSQQVLLLALQRFLEQSHANATRWRMRMSINTSAEAQARVWELVSGAFAASFACYASEDLDVLLGAMGVLHTLTQVRPAVLLPHLRQLLPLLPPLVTKRAAFSKEVSYGPLTKVVDGGVGLRLAVWRAVVGIAPLLGQLVPAQETQGNAGVAAADAPVRSTLLGLLLTGLSDPAPEVRLSVHAAVAPLTHRLPLDAAQWQQLAEQLVLSIQSPPPENAVREELLAHAEVVQSATRAGSQLVAALEQAELFPDIAALGADTLARVAQARAQLQRAVDAQQHAEKQLKMQ